MIPKNVEFTAAGTAADVIKTVEVPTPATYTPGAVVAAVLAASTALVCVRVNVDSGVVEVATDAVVIGAGETVAVFTPDDVTKRVGTFTGANGDSAFHSPNALAMVIAPVDPPKPKFSVAQLVNAIVQAADLATTGDYVLVDQPNGLVKIVDGAGFTTFNVVATFTPDPASVSTAQVFE